MEGNAMDRNAELANCRLWADLALDHHGLEAGQMSCVWNWRLKSRMGQCKGRTVRGSRVVVLEFSPEIFERATPDERNNTAAHEAAHGVVFLLHGGIRRGRRWDHHGPVWQRTMLSLGFEPTRCHSVDTTGIGRKTHRLTCLSCQGSLGSCTPAKAAKLAASRVVRVRCCGTVPGSMILAVRA